MKELDNSRTLLLYLEAMMSARAVASRRESKSIAQASQSGCDDKSSEILNEWSKIFQNASPEMLETLRDRVCAAGLAAIDRQMATSETGRFIDSEAGSSDYSHEQARVAGNRGISATGLDSRIGENEKETTRNSELIKGNYALIAMPWFWAHMPSIQLAIVKNVLEQKNIKSHVMEFYTDFIDIVGANLFREIANIGTYIGEILFSQFYFDNIYKNIEDLAYLNFCSKGIQDDILRFATPLTDKFLDACREEVCATDYDAICFTITAQQMGATIALVKRIRDRRPKVPIVVGGAGCAGDMGVALLEMCPEIDIVVHSEAEMVLPDLVEALQGNASLAEVEGISWRSGEEIRTGPVAKLHALSRQRNSLNFDSYFERIQHGRILANDVVWLPFESSRGCWYGEKVQCTFCGLNEIIKYRERGTGGLLEELEAYETRYGARNFFAVDLIMPRSFFDALLPSIEAAGKKWTIFYEVKSNMRRGEIELLARSGIRWIQPGIESLDDTVLKLMRKGVSAAQNIQTLRYSKEQGIAVSWNLISNFPNEAPESYESMAKLFPLLHHLDAPSGISPFEVHRFSPFHATPQELGIRVLGPHEKYKQVFPVADELLERLVYRFRYELLDPLDSRLAASRQKVADAVGQWQDARRRGADFRIDFRRDGTARLVDTRASEQPIETSLDRSEATLLRFLEEMRPTTRLVDVFSAGEPEAFASLGGEEGLRGLIEDFKQRGLVIEISGTVQALARNARVAAKSAVAA